MTDIPELSTVRILGVPTDDAPWYNPLIAVRAPRRGDQGTVVDVHFFNGTPHYLVEATSDGRTLWFCRFPGAWLELVAEPR